MELFGASTTTVAQQQALSGTTQESQVVKSTGSLFFFFFLLFVTLIATFPPALTHTPLVSLTVQNRSSVNMWRRNVYISISKSYANIRLAQISICVSEAEETHVLAEFAEA
eukprot:RCo047621